MDKLQLTRTFCQFLPPILSQKIREKMISESDGKKFERKFKRKAFTGGEFVGNTKDIHAFRFFVHGYYEWRNIVLVKHFLNFKPGDLIEIGANVGTETVSLSNLNKSYNVHAFEPLETNYNYLEKIKKENNYANLHLYKFLVSDKEGTANFKIPDENNSGSGYIARKKEVDTKNLQVITLDKKLAHISSCSAIIIDVEGYEINVIRGSRNIIKKHKPFLIMEVNPLFVEKRANLSVASLYQELLDLGYESFYIDKMKLTKIEIQNFKVRSNKNWVCIPFEHLKYKKRLSRAIFTNAINPFISLQIF